MFCLMFFVKCVSMFQKCSLIDVVNLEIFVAVVGESVIKTVTENAFGARLRTGMLHCCTSP